MTETTNTTEEQSVNKTMIIGRVHREPIIGTTNTKKKEVANLSIVTTETYVNTEGEEVTRREYHRVVAWGTKKVEICRQLEIGDKVYIEGKNQTRRIFKDGEEKPTHVAEIIATEIILL